MTGNIIGFTFLFIQAIHFFVSWYYNVKPVGRDVSHGVRGMSLFFPMLIFISFPLKYEAYRKVLGERAYGYAIAFGLNHLSGFL